MGTKIYNKTEQKRKLGWAGHKVLWTIAESRKLQFGAPVTTNRKPKKSRTLI